MGEARAAAAAERPAMAELEDFEKQDEVLFNGDDIVGLIKEVRFAILFRDWARCCLVAVALTRRDARIPHTATLACLLIVLVCGVRQSVESVLKNVTYTHTKVPQWTSMVCAKPTSPSATLGARSI